MSNSIIKTYNMSQSTILRLYSEREDIKLNPEYQRNGDVWTIYKKQLLIDSIINDYDIPKLYFHQLNNDSEYEYAVIDGRQRIETIWQFLEDKFPLEDEFVYYKEPDLKVGGMTYSDLADHYPKIRIQFDSFALPVVVVDTDDIDLIEDMFSRLNEAVSLNAAEKRNAIGGHVVKAINTLSKHKFFQQKVKFSNKRYQYKEVAVRLLFIEHCVQLHGKLIDTKKAFLDDFTRHFKTEKPDYIQNLRRGVAHVLDLMMDIFDDGDALLRSQSAIPIYFLLTAFAYRAGELKNVSRDLIARFRADIDRNKMFAEEDLASANFDLLEYDRLSQQGTNDASSIRRRAQILCDYMGVTYAHDPLFAEKK